MTHREFVWWRALFEISPFDDERCFDLPAAHIATQVNLLRGGEAELKDFIPYRRKEPAPPDDPSGGLMGYLHSRNTRNH
jgi:hypothetical protein